ncbi:hypothetical protein P4388_25180 [Bacillus thuringiensis]|nr:MULTISPECIES: hypothetical protein [Bacillus cereus group]MDA2615437.1 hypothetical protein [Bacillus cereus]MEB8555434.1 hypothetical protein [Bacillus cereus]MEB8728113.1 hypothetical protein [Bacillus cereus]MEB8820397.1 hypothetical protein [Bacillus cereus]MEB8975601.1 hypothetical protein [Bacillus cereus]
MALAETNYFNLNEIAEKSFHKLMKQFLNEFSEEDSKKRVDMQ